MEKRDIVLFLGAGVSHYAGFPIMKEFGVVSRAEYDNLRNEKKKAIDILLPAGKTFEEFQKYCSNAKNIINIDTDNMEDIFCIAESMKECDIKEIPDIKNDKGGNLTVEELIKQIKLWLWKIFQRLPPYDDDEKKPGSLKSPPYKKFFEIINKMGLSSKVTAITTNYDLVFEYFSWDAGIPCKYPFEYNPLILRHDKDEKGSEIYQEYLSDDKSAPFLCKLHGSINYFSKDKENIYVTQNIFEQGQGWGISRVPKRDPKTKGKPAILLLDAIWHITENIDNKLVPAIIPPTYSKLTGYPWLRKIWNTAFNAIQNAEKLIFIGYRFPESDGFMKALFQGAFAHRKNSNPPKIFVLDPHARKEDTLGKRYRNIFKPLGEKIEFLPFYFEQIDKEWLFNSFLS
jgi:hypothetical protein